MLNWKRIGLHAGITLALYLAGAGTVGIILGRENSNLQARNSELTRQGAEVTDKLLQSRAESKELGKLLEGANLSIGRLEGRVTDLTESYNRLEQRYLGLKNSIGGFIEEIAGLGSEFDSFGIELQGLIQYILTISERS
jgi:chromosome segregation ATPase